MQRIDHPSNIPAPQAVEPTNNPGYFRRPSALLGDQGTVLTGDWANDIQEAIAQAIEGVNIPLLKGDGAQLANAIALYASQAVFGHNIQGTDAFSGHWRAATLAETEAGLADDRVLTPANVPTSAPFVRGLIARATAALVRAGIDDGTAVTPASLAADNVSGNPFSFSLAGGIIVKGGTVNFPSAGTANVVFATPFPNAIWGLYATGPVDVLPGGGATPIGYAELDNSDTTMAVIGSLWAPRNISWLAVGN